MENSKDWMILAQGLKLLEKLSCVLYSGFNRRNISFSLKSNLIK